MILLDEEKEHDDSHDPHKHRLPGLQSKAGCDDHEDEHHGYRHLQQAHGKKQPDVGFVSMEEYLG